MPDGIILSTLQCVEGSVLTFELGGPRAPTFGLILSHNSLISLLNRIEPVFFNTSDTTGLPTCCFLVEGRKHIGYRSSHRARWVWSFHSIPFHSTVHSIVPFRRIKTPFQCQRSILIMYNHLPMTPCIKAAFAA